MAKCDYCNSTILLGGVSLGKLRFCNQKCYQDGFLLTTSQQVPADIVKQQVDQLHKGNVPSVTGAALWTCILLTKYFLFSSLRIGALNLKYYATRVESRAR